MSIESEYVATKYNYAGCINLVIGPMFSGKTTEIITRYKRHIENGKRCLMVKFKGDTRYSSSMVVSHTGEQVEAVVCDLLQYVDKLVIDCDVVCIDEAQFYEDAPVFCDKWANEGKCIEICGLSGTFNRTPFHVISQLVPIAENILHLKAVCQVSGGDASFVRIHDRRAVSDKFSTVLIGGSELYSPVNRKHYFNSAFDCAKWTNVQ